ncbi:MAG: serine/threonine-protein phosphatase [Deltaproteobacteria bacterium]|nr:serine/threonine-protein phosphatase [Deltaproteobacteria bacterium]
MQTEATRPEWIRVRAAGDTHIGLRDHNEDSVLLRKELGVFVLADGAGGEAAGSTASALATTAVAHYFERTQAEARKAPTFDSLGLATEARRLSASVHAANDEIHHLAHKGGRYAGMATTVVVAYLPRGAGILHLAHVGDSRAYRLRGSQLELLTEDHSLLRDVLELAPNIDDAKAAALPRAVITRALGVEPRVRVTIRSFEVLPGDRFMLCSDGLTDELDDEQLREALLEGKSPEATVALLLEVADAAGAVDNVAALVIDCAATAASGTRPPVQLRSRSTKRPRPMDADFSYPEVLIIEDESDEEGDEAADDQDVPDVILDGDAEEESSGDGDEPPGAAEPEVDEDASTKEIPGLRMVPEGSATPARMEAVRHFLRPLPASARPHSGERDPTLRFHRSCKKCGAQFDGTKDNCPNCWDGE